MLIKISVENFRSFDNREELSMISSSKIRSMPKHKMKIKQTNILKNAAIYGANASGKSNLVQAFGFIKTSLINGVPLIGVNDFCKNRTENKNKESVFELQFTVGKTFYAYGFSVILNERKITNEWLFELMQNGSAKELFTRPEGIPKIGETIKLSDEEKARFNIYSNDFADQNDKLFLSEMNRGKKYNENSKLKFFNEAYSWIINNIILIDPDISFTNTDSFYNDETLDNVTNLIKDFDTGITDIKIKNMSIDKLSEILPTPIIQNILNKFKSELQKSGDKDMQMTCKINGGFFNIKLDKNGEPEITTFILKHGKSIFDFSFSDESDGTTRLFDLIDMILTDRPDTLFVVDELDRSLHPKLTEHFLKLFMKTHENSKMQLVFTTHEDLIMSQKLLRRDEIWFIERDAENSSHMYSLDKFKERYDKKLKEAYLDGRYGAIPVFKHFTFKEE